MECQAILSILDTLENDSIPSEMHQRIEEHIDTCHTCKAGIANFLQIGKILEKTVYGRTGKDDLLRYLSHLNGSELHWETDEKRKERTRRKVSFRLLVKIVAGFIAAAGIGASLAVILSYLGWIGSSPVSELELAATSGQEELAPMENQAAAEDSLLPAVVPDGGMNPDAVYRYINSGPQSAGTPSVSTTPAPAPRDSATLRNLEAELGALRDAITRDPTDTDLRQRTMDKYRQVIDERKRLKLSLSVQDYYNLGYLHYEQAQYPQTAIVTAEGLRLVRMGPVQYLHYLNAMSHYKIAMSASEPLPADSSADSLARVRGAQMRAELDREGRRRAINELRKATAEFGNMLSTPALAKPAQDWILRCNEQIAKLTGSE